MKRLLDLKILILMGGLLALPTPAQAGTFTNNFNADPSAEITILPPAKWVDTGGVNNSGYISLTDAANDQSNGTIVLPDLDAGAAIGGFEARFDLRIGGGTARPADGASFSFSPDATESTAVGEEGTTTGIVISFDTWDNAGTDTAPAIDIKVNNEVVATAFMAGEREGGRARPGPIATNPATGQELSLDTGDAFVPVDVTFRGGLLSMNYRGAQIFNNVPILFSPSPGRFVFGARTGNANANHWIDNLQINTFPPATTPTLSFFNGNPAGVALTLSDAATQVNTNSIQLTVNGTVVSPTISRQGTNTFINFAAPTLLAAGSSNAVTLVYSDTGTPGTTVTNQLSFIVAPYTVLPAGFAAPGSTVETNASGFSVRVHQLPVTRTPGDENSPENAERQIAGAFVDPTTGQPYPNEANLTAAVNGVFTVTNVVNWNQDAGTGADIGNFRDTTTPPRPDQPIPGIPGTGGGTDNIAAEIIAFLELEPGFYRMGVNSDDGFKVTAGQNPRSATAPVLGLFNTGRGSADTLFDFVVQTRGIYPFRLLWWEGTGGANVEWFTMNAFGQRVLINDREVPGAVRAYPTGPLPPYIASFSPAAGALVPPDEAISLVLSNGATSLAANSIQLFLNNTNVTSSSTISNTAGGASIRFQPATFLAAGSTNTVRLIFGDTSTPSATFTNEYTFVTARLPVLLPCFATAIGSGTSPGFTIRVVQAVATPELPNTSARAEQQLAGTIPAESSGTNTPEIINYVQAEGETEGNFAADAPAPFDVPDNVFPGLGTHTDNIAAEVIAYLELPAGVHRFGVNSDDGFKVTSGPTPSNTNLVLGIFEGGRGASDTLFDVIVEQPGVYPFRLIWYEGGGGANLEWFSVNRTNGQRVLINSSATGAIRAFQSRTGQPTTPCDGGNPPGGTNTNSTLTATLAGNNISIAWQSAGTLEQAESVGGPWTPVANATSPFTAPISGTQRFYRLRP